MNVDTIRDASSNSPGGGNGYAELVFCLLSRDLHEARNRSAPEYRYGVTGEVISQHAPRGILSFAWHNSPMVVRFILRT